MRLQLIPDINIDNKNTDTLINNIHFFRSPMKRLRITKDYIEIQPQYQIAYEIELSTSGAQFYLFFPDEIKSAIQTEINLTWPKITTKEKTKAVQFKNPVIIELNMKHHYFMSLKVDKRGLTPLPAILETMKLLKDDDKVLIQVVFEPESYDWFRSCEAAIKDFNNGYVPRRIELNKRNIKEGIIKGGIKTIEAALSTVSFFLTDEEMEFEDINSIEYEQILRNGLSNNTLGKSKWNGFNTQIRIVSDSKDSIRQESIIRSLIIAFKGLDEDNKLIEKRIKNTNKYLRYIQKRQIKFDINKNILSAAELGQIIQLPTKAYQEIYNLENIDTREIEIPNELQHGNIIIGVAKYKGLNKTTYWPDHKNILSLPKVVIGPMGSGKSEYTKKFSIDANRKDDGVIVFDFIKDCDLSESISKYVDAIKINLADHIKLSALAYPEMQPGKDPWERLKVANILSRQSEYLINSVTDAETGPLTAPMLRYLNAASMVVFIHPDKTLDDVFKCLKNWQVRNEYIRLAKYSGCFTEDDEVFYDLQDLHERDSDGKIVGTREHLIIGIVNRISALNRDIYLKKMLKAQVNYEQNFAKWMDEGRTILIQIPESTFTNKSIKDTLVTYYMSRIWLAALQRKNHNRVCHVITDEIHQVPTAAALVSNIITEARKFGVDFYFTIHYLKQFRQLHDAIRSAGCSYMLLAGTEKENLKALEEELQPFSIQEGLNLKPFHSLNIINYSNQYAKFITKLPGPIKC